MMRVPNNLRRGGVGFNMTPMIDIVFLLIVFFIVAGHLAKQESQYELPLPRADSSTDAVDDDAPCVIVNVLPDGRLLLAGKSVNHQQLHERLAFERKWSGDALEVRIRGDRSVPYQFVEPILLASARAKIWNVTFAVFKREE